MYLMNMPSTVRFRTFSSQRTSVTVSDEHVHRTVVLILLIMSETLTIEKKNKHYFSLEDAVNEP